LIIMDEAPIGRQSERALVRIGRTERSANNPAIGYVVVNGQVEVAGKLNATAVNANQYSLRGVPLQPGTQASALASWLRALEQYSRAMQAQDQARAEAPESAGSSAGPQSTLGEEPLRNDSEGMGEPSASEE
jgi:hypothetical protein